MYLMSAEKALLEKLQSLAEFLETNKEVLPPSSWLRCYKRLSPEHQSTLDQFTTVELDSGTLQKSTPAPALQLVEWKPPASLTTEVAYPVPTSGSQRDSQYGSESDSGSKRHPGRRGPQSLPILSLTSIKPPDSLKLAITKWQADPSKLFHRAASEHDAANCHSLVAVFKRIERNDRDILIAVIQQRFDYYFCYKTAVYYGLYRPDEGWVTHGSERFAEIVVSSCPQSCDVKEVQLKSVDYVDRGSNYNRWAGALGGPGIFIMLPQEVAEGRKDFISSTATFTNFPQVLLKAVSREVQRPVGSPHETRDSRTRKRAERPISG